jgi:hypothetical protein
MAGSQSQPTFELGLVMAGAVSGGAYTAGVIDFLIQALDAWEAAKAQNADVPRHQVLIPVLSGAYAGAIVAAIATVTFGSETRPVADPAAPPPAEANRLYDAWVRQVDIGPLLGRRDLDGADKVTSLLDSTSLREIAERALRMRARPAPRACVADPLAVFLTVSNLRGVPYGFHLFGSRPDTLYGMSCHTDHIAFALSAAGRTLPHAIPLRPAEAPAGNWPRLALAAIASGAFPVGLQPRDLERSYADYQDRFDRRPRFGDAVDPYRLLAVDGGLMDNEPLELARRHLARGGPPNTNPRSGDQASRAVPMVDPFPNQIDFDPNWKADDRLVQVIAAMFTALKNQARFKPEELVLAEGDRVFSRFIISPSRTLPDGTPAEPAMAAAILGGFGGFLHEDFRRHDFQLGRRNCQAFLRWHFGLPETNPLFDGLAEAQRAAWAIRQRDGRPVTATGQDGRELRMLPIVPLVGEADREVPSPQPVDGDRVDVQELEKRIRKRLQAVGSKLIDTELAQFTNAAQRWALRTGWQLLVAGPVNARIMRGIRNGLGKLH